MLGTGPLVAFKTGRISRVGTMHEVLGDDAVELGLSVWVGELSVDEAINVLGKIGRIQAQ